MNGYALSLCERPTLIKMRQYGPVAWTGTAAPFIIERRAIASANSWVDHSACFTRVPDTNTTIVNLTASTLLQSGFEYRVRLRKDGSNNNILRCDIAGQPPAADHASDYVFTVGDQSPGDANSDGVVNFDDISSVLANWPPTSCLNDGDADRNGAVDFDDITSVLANWLAEYPCPGMMMASSSSSGNIRTMDDAIAAMGFEGAPEYALFLADLDQEQREMVVLRVKEWLNAGGSK